MSSRADRIARCLIAALVLLLLTSPPVAGAGPERHPVQAPAYLAAPVTVYQASCPQPRPPVKVNVVPEGDGQLRVTVTAGFGTLFVVNFGAMRNAHVVLPGSNQIVTSNSEIPIPPGLTSWTFTVVFDGASQPGPAPPSANVPFTIFDGCGLNHPWRTFVGGGVNALVSAIEIGDAEIVEGNTGARIVTLPIRLTLPSRRQITVAYAIASGTASAPTDFTAGSGVVTFAPGETQKTIQLQTSGDFDAEADETLTVTLSNPTNAVLRRSVATVKIVNDDTAPSASGDAYVATAGTPLAVSAGSGLLANDQPGTQSPQVVSFGGLDVGGNATSFPAGSAATLPGGGALLVRADGSFSFTSAPGIAGSLSFQYRARSLSGQSDATVIISVLAAPTANDDPSLAVTPPAGLNVPAPGLLGNDSPGTPPGVVVQFGGLDAGGGLGTGSASPAGTARDLGNGGSLTVNGDGSFAFTAPSTAGGPFRFQYRLQSSVGFDDATVTINVRRSPVVTTTSGATAFAEGSSPVVVDPGLTVTQPGGTNLTGATVTIANPSDAGQESLTASVGATGILASFAGDTLTLTNSSSVANYQQVLRSVAYGNAASAPTTGNRSIRFQVSDGALTSNPADKVVSVGSVNDAPAGADKTVATLEDTSYTFTLADFGFTDPSDAPANSFAAVKVASLPAVGSLAHSSVAVAVGQTIPVASIAGGLLRFTPAAGAAGSPYTSFTFQVQDNGGIANGGADLDPTPNIITVNVTPVNDAPAGADKTVTTDEDTSYTFTAADFGFSDPNDTPPNVLAGVTIATLPSAGALKNDGTAVTAGQTIPVVDITAGKLQFIPVANAHGTPYASFTFQVQDNGGTANGGANTDPTVNTITINVTSIDDPPVCPNDAATIDEDTDLIAKKLTDVEIMETSPPVVTTSIGTTTFTTKCGPVVVDNQVIVTDPDSSTIASATIKITNVKNGAAESLDVDLTGLPVITKTTSRTDGTFTLTLTGPASRVTFRSVLRRVTYNNNSNDVNLDNRVIQFQVSDGHSNSNTAVKTVLVVEAVDD